MDDEMRIVRASEKMPFTVIPNAIFDDLSLQRNELSLLSYVLSRPPNWQVRFRQIRERLGMGRKMTQIAIRHLRAAGYVRLMKRRGDDGLLSGTFYYFFSTPQPPENPCKLTPYVDLHQIGQDPDLPPKLWQLPASKVPTRKNAPNHNSGSPGKAGLGSALCNVHQPQALTQIRATALRQHKSTTTTESTDYEMRYREVTSPPPRKVTPVIKNKEKTEEGASSPPPGGGAPRVKLFSKTRDPKAKLLDSVLADMIRSRSVDDWTTDTVRLFNRYVRSGRITRREASLIKNFLPDRPNGGYTLYQLINLDPSKLVVYAELRKADYCCTKLYIDDTEPTHYQKREFARAHHKAVDEIIVLPEGVNYRDLEDTIEEQALDLDTVVHRRIALHRVMNHYHDGSRLRHMSVSALIHLTRQSAMRWCVLQILPTADKFDAVFGPGAWSFFQGMRAAQLKFMKDEEALYADIGGIFA